MFSNLVDRVSRPLLHSEPFFWPEWTGLLDDTETQTLAEAVSGLEYEEVANASARKSYRMWKAPLVRGSGVVVGGDSVDPLRNFVSTLTSLEYISALGRSVGLDLGSLKIEMTAWRYAPDCYLGAHPDDPPKVFTQLFYLNPGWDASWGGELVLLTQDLEPAVEIVPSGGLSVGIRRSELSWHQVRAVACDAFRSSIQLVFYAD